MLNKKQQQAALYDSAFTFKFSLLTKDVKLLIFITQNGTLRASIPFPNQMSPAPVLFVPVPAQPLKRARVATPAFTPYSRSIASRDEHVVHNGFRKPRFERANVSILILVICLLNGLPVLLVKFK